MQKLFVVSFVSGKSHLVECASEDGKCFRAPTADWAHLAEPVRTIVDGMVSSAMNGAQHGRVDRWLRVQGVYEFWTASREVADAVVQTVGFANVFVPHRYDDFSPM